MTKTIQGFPLYEISDNGEVRNIKTGAIRKQSIGKNGYKVLDLYNNGISKKFYVHRLLMLTFVSNPYNKRTVNHIDGDKTNNSLSNLEWATDSENIQHAHDTGLNGVDKKLSDDTLLEIFNVLKVGETTLTDLAKEYDVALATLTVNLRELLRSLNREQELDTAIDSIKDRIGKKAGLNRRCSTCIKQINITTYDVVNTFKNVTEAMLHLGVKSAGPISNSVSGVTSKGYGFYWIEDCSGTTNYSDVKSRWVRKRRSKNKYVGVGFRKDTGRWRAYRDNVSIGSFSSEEEAIAARNAYMIKNNLINEVQTIIK